MPSAQRCGGDPLPGLPRLPERPRLRAVPGARDEAALFSSLLASTARGRRPRLDLAASGAIHLVILAALALVPILWPSAIPESHRDYVRVLIYDPPPPPPPPLPKGSPLRPAARAATREAPPTRRPEPALTAPVQAPPVAEETRAVAEASVTETYGSETGSEAGVPEGMAEGVEGGVVGGVPGGVLGGVLGGTGTGDVPVAVRDYDRPPRPIRITKPDYPQEAFVKKVEGTVVVEILIDANGRVVRARVVRSVPMLDAAALETVRQWSFAPAIKHGRAVAALAQAPISFRIF